MDHDDDGETSYNTFVDDVAFEPTYSQALLTAAGRNIATLGLPFFCHALSLFHSCSRSTSFSFRTVHTPASDVWLGTLPWFRHASKYSNWKWWKLNRLVPLKMCLFSRLMKIIVELVFRWERFSPLWHQLTIAWFVHLLCMSSVTVTFPPPYLQPTYNSASQWWK